MLRQMHLCSSCPTVSSISVLSCFRCEFLKLFSLSALQHATTTNCHNTPSCTPEGPSLVWAFCRAVGGVPQPFCPSYLGNSPKSLVECSSFAAPFHVSPKICGLVGARIAPGIADSHRQKQLLTGWDSFGVCNTRTMRTWRRRDRDVVDSEADGVGERFPFNSHRKQDWSDKRNRSHLSAKDTWSEHIAGGNSNAQSSSGIVRPWVTANEAARNASYGKGGGSGFRDSTISSFWHQSRIEATGNSPPPEFQRPTRWQERQEQQQQQQQEWERREKRVADKKANDARLDAQARLSKARTWRDLEQVLDNTPQHHLGPHQISAAIVTYWKISNGIQLSRSGSSTDVAAQGPLPPPLGLRERLQASLLQAVPMLSLRQLSFCMYQLSTLPAAHSLTVGNDVGHELMNMLLNRLEAHLYDLADQVSKMQLADLSRPVAAGDGGGNTVAQADQQTTAGSKPDMTTEVQCLTHLCTAVRRMKTARPSVYRALAAAAMPMLGWSLAGDSLAPLVLCFLEAGNPEPIFMEQLMHHSSLPHSLSRTTSVFAATVLLRAAGISGAGSSVLSPLASHLAELYKKAFMQTKSHKGSGASTPDTGTGPAGGGATGGGGATAETAAAATTSVDSDAGEAEEQSSMAASPPSMFAPAEQPTSLQPGRIRPSRGDSAISHILHACVVNGLPIGSELVTLMLEEVQNRRCGWDMLHRLMIAGHLHSLGLNVTETLAASSLPPPSSSSSESPSLEQQQSQQAGKAEEGRGEGSSGEGSRQLVLISEKEIVDFLQRPEVSLKSLLTVLYGISQLCRCHVFYDGGVAAVLAAATVAEKLDEEEKLPHHKSKTDPVICMSTALGIAVQRVDAAAPLMASQQAMHAMSSLATAGAIIPPLLLLRAEQLFQESPVSRSGAANEEMGCSSEGDSDSQQLQNPMTNSAAAGVSSYNVDSGDSGRDGCSSAGTVSRSEVALMCVMVGRVLAWQPAAISAAKLSEEFVRHCRDAAMNITRRGFR